MSMREFDISDALARLKAAGDKYDPPTVVVEEPKPKPRYELPPTGSFAVYKRNPKGMNKLVYMNLPKSVAVEYTNHLNNRELSRREEERIMANDRAIEYVCENPIFYEYVEEGGPAENPYWNPSRIII